MAPECFVGESGGSYGSAVDAYAYSVLLLEMHVNGEIKQAFNNLGTMIVINRVTTQKWGPNLKALEGSEPDIADIVAKGWSQEPEDRPSFKQVISKLKAFMDEHTTKDEEFDGNFAGITSRGGGGGVQQHCSHSKLASPSPTARTEIELPLSQQLKARELFHDEDNAKAAGLINLMGRSHGASAPLRLVQEENKKAHLPT